MTATSKWSAKNIRETILTAIPSFQIYSNESGKETQHAAFHDLSFHTKQLTLKAAHLRTGIKPKLVQNSACKQQTRNIYKLSKTHDLNRRRKLWDTRQQRLTSTWKQLLGVEQTRCWRRQQKKSKSETLWGVVGRLAYHEPYTKKRAGVWKRTGSAVAHVHRPATQQHTVV